MARLSSLLFPFLFFLHLAPVLLLAQTAVCDEAVPSSGNSGSSSNDNAENEGPVITELTDATFDDFLKDNDYCVVLFYVPWSSYCQDFLPVFEEVAKSVRGSTAAAVGMIQVMKNKGVAASQEIESFPTLRIYIKGIGTEYTGERTYEKVLQFIEKGAHPAFTELRTQEEVNQFIAAHPLSVIACIKDSSTNSFQSAFEHTAEEMYLRSDIAFGWGHSSSVVGSSQCPSLVMRRPGTEAPEEYDPSTSKALQQELAAWVARRAVEPVGEIDSGTIDQYMAIDLPLAWVITPGKIDPALLASLKPVAAEFAEEVALVWMNDEAHPGQTRHLGVNHRGLPTLVITADTRRYILTPRSTEFSADTVRAFIKDFLADKLTPHVRSQEAPSEAENARRAVKVAVGMNFEALVRDTAKDVIVNFYAPWCGHCQALAPVYEQAAKLLAPVQTVVFAEMDATENDLPRDVAVTGYPTLYLFPAAATGAKEEKKEKEKDEVVVGEAVPMPVRYTGDRSVAGIVRFIQENAATKFALPEDLREFVEQEESFVAARIAEMNRESEEAKAAVEGRNEAEEKKEKKKKEEEDKSAEVKKAEEKVEETSTVTETTKEEL